MEGIPVFPAWFETVDLHLARTIGNQARNRLTFADDRPAFGFTDFPAQGNIACAIDTGAGPDHCPVRSGVAAGDPVIETNRPGCLSRYADG